MAFPGTGLGHIYGHKNTLPLQQWIEIINDQNKVVCIHKETKNIGLFTNANLTPALQKGYEKISFETIENITKEKIKECEDATLIERAEQSLENLKKRSLAVQKSVTGSDLENISQQRFKREGDSLSDLNPSKKAKTASEKGTKIDDIITLTCQMIPSIKKTELQEKSKEELYRKIYSLIKVLIFSPNYLNLEQLKQIYEIFSLIEKESFTKTKDEENFYNMMRDLYECTLDVGDINQQKNARIEECKGDYISEKVFFLKGSKGNEKRWVFKQERPPGTSGATTIACELQPKRELMSYLVDFHHKFSIPFTVLLHFQGKNYSVHQYIEGTLGLVNMEKDEASSKGKSSSDEKMEAKPSSDESAESSQDSSDDYQPMDKSALHRLLIFDLIFSNGDRTEANMIFIQPTTQEDSEDSKENAGHQVVGIDHGDCMVEEENTIKMDYLTLKAFSFDLDEEAYNLVSEENEANYYQIMQKEGFGIPLSAVKWMHFSCQCIRYIKGKNFCAKQIAEILIYIHKFFNKNDLDIDENLNKFKAIISNILDYRKILFSKTKEEALKKVLEQLEPSPYAEFLKAIFRDDSFQKIFTSVN